MPPLRTLHWSLLLGVSLGGSFACGARTSAFNDLGLDPASVASANSPPAEGVPNPGAGGESVVSQGGSGPIGGGRPELGAGGPASGGAAAGAGAPAAGGAQAEGGAATDFAGAAGAAAGDAAAGEGPSASGASGANAGGHGGSAPAGGGSDPGTAGAPASNCCTPHATPSCDVAAISECICQGHGHFGGDPFCCTGAWDDQCAGELKTFGCGVCPALP